MVIHSPRLRNVVWGPIVDCPVDGVLNVSVNCLDRHLDERGDQTAIIWEPDSPDAEPRRYSYRQVHAEVCRFANVLKAAGLPQRVLDEMPAIA